MKWLVLGLIFLDWGQTLDAHDYKATGCAHSLGKKQSGTCDAPPYYENNPVLGAHPQEHQVNGYFAAASLGHLYLYDEYKWYREKGVYFVAGMQTGTVIRNYQLGIAVNF